jgi:predicted PurR-regulated permease PerM
LSCLVLSSLISSFAPPLTASFFFSSSFFSPIDFNLQYLRTQLVTVITWLGNNFARFFGTAIEVATNLSSFIFSLIVFVSSLFYFLVVSTSGSVSFFFLLPPPLPLSLPLPLLLPLPAPEKAFSHQSKDDIIQEIGKLSPFDPSDNEKLKESIRNSITRTFFCSLLVGLLHATTTFASFSLTGIELKVIFSLLSGFLSTLPILSSWVIWVPACAYLYMIGR